MNKLTGRRKFTTHQITSLAILAALSIVLVYFVRIPMFLPFLEYDPADISIFIATFTFGPLVGLILTVVVAVIQGLTVSASSGVIGIFMHLIATGTFVIIAGNLYKRNKTRKGAAIAMCVGVAAWTLVMILWNIILTPIFMNVSREEVVALILPAFLPFNLIKPGINSVVTFLLYKPLARLIRGKTARPSAVGEVESA